MSVSTPYLGPAEAAERLGVSAKALRLYEERGLLAPVRTGAGWRAYGPAQMARAAEIVALRALGLSLAEVGRVLQGDAAGLELALAAHQARLEAGAVAAATTIGRVRAMRASLARGETPAAEDLARLAWRPSAPVVAFDLPWPWAGERFELRAMPAITYLTGPLGSGKTRLARRLAEALPEGRFLGPDRSAATARARLDADPALARRVERALAWLAEDGAGACDALVALLAEIEDEAPGALVIDMVEQDLDEAAQGALIAYLRRRPGCDRPLVLMTRSSAILDLRAVGADEAVLYCPANHDPPMRVLPYPGAPGYEAVAMCLAAPDVRARTAGTIAWRPTAA